MNEHDLQALIAHLRRQLGERLDAVVLFGSRTYWGHLTLQTPDGGISTGGRR